MHLRLVKSPTDEQLDTLRQHLEEQRACVQVLTARVETLLRALDHMEELLVLKCQELDRLRAQRMS